MPGSYVTSFAAFSVINRKVTNRFRAEWAAKTDAAMQSVADTANLSGANADPQFTPDLAVISVD